MCISNEVVSACEEVALNSNDQACLTSNTLLFVLRTFDPYFAWAATYRTFPVEGVSDRTEGVAAVAAPRPTRVAIAVQDGLPERFQIGHEFLLLFDEADTVTDG